MMCFPAALDISCTCRARSKKVTCFIDVLKLHCRDNLHPTTESRSGGPDGALVIVSPQGTLDCAATWAVLIWGQSSLPDRRRQPVRPLSLTLWRPGGGLAVPTHVGPQQGLQRQAPPMGRLQGHRSWPASAQAGLKPSRRRPSDTAAAPTIGRFLVLVLQLSSLHRLAFTN